MMSHRLLNHMQKRRIGQASEHDKQAMWHLQFDVMHLEGLSINHVRKKLSSNIRAYGLLPINFKPIINACENTYRLFCSAY